MIRKFLRRVVLASAWAVAVFHASAQTANLLPVADTYLRNSNPDGNFGSGPTLLVGVSKSGSVINHALLKFSLDGIPTNATITGASLQLTSTGGIVPAQDFTLDRLLVDWGEMDATWNTRLAPATGWDTGGGTAGTDYAPTPSAVAPIGPASSVNTFSSDDMAADVQGWLNNPGSNFGWILIAQDEQAASGEMVGSREASGSEPVLTVTYTAPAAAPASPVISGVKFSAGKLSLSFNAEAGRAYAVEFNGSLSPTNWATLTNYSAPPSATNFMATDRLTSSNRFYRVRTP
jgi:hypothetical protein